MFTSLQDLIKQGFTAQSERAEEATVLVAQLAIEQAYQSCLMELQAEKE